MQQPLSRTTGKQLDGWLRKQSRHIRRPLSASIAVGTVDGLLLILQAWLLASVIRGVVIGGMELSNVWPWLGWLPVVFVARAVVSALTRITAFEAAARIRLDLRKRLYDHMHRLSPQWMSAQRSGDLAHVLVDGVEALEKYYADYLPQTAIATFIPAAILVAVFPFDWVSGLILLITAPLIPLFMIIIGKGAERLNQRQWRRLARMSAHFFDTIEGLTTLKLFGAGRREAELVGRISEDYRHTTMAVLRIAFLSSLVLEFLAAISIAMVAVYVGFRLYYGEMGFLPGLFVLLLAPEFYQPLRGMGTQYHARMEAIGAAENIVALLRETPPETRHVADKRADEQPLNLTFQQVGFAYDERPVLTDIDFTLQHGQRIALVGPSGAGKTTLVRLVLGLLQPDHGHIRTGTTDLQDVPTAAWLNRIAWLAQRPTLFHGNIRDNIRLGRPEATDEQIRHAARQANAADFIEHLPGGYDTRVGERGQGLSGGEIQRIALARAFLKDAELIVLDEASASLDPETEALVTDSIERLARNRAMLVIAHRLETVRQADRILVLDGGRIVEQGSHVELMDRGGRYADMLALYRGQTG